MSIVLPEQAVLHNGLVAMKYRRQQRIVVKCSGRNHIFNMRANISMCFIPPEDVNCCLAVRGGCCGQKKKGVIVFANEDDVRRWLNGGGR